MTRTDRRRFPAIAALALTGAVLGLLFSPLQAQAGSAPAKPMGLSATLSDDRVVLTWEDPDDDTITGYVILRRIRVNNVGGEFGVLEANTGSAATTYTDDTVAAGITYTYRIKAINEHGESERSLWFHIDTPSAPVPDKPTGLTAVASDDRVVLTWEDPDDDTITGYVILRRIRVNNVGGEFGVLEANTGSAATTYTDDTVAAGITYTYRIKAINEHGESERSLWFHIDTPSAPVPDKPTGLTAVASDDRVVLTWEDPSDDSITGYVILRRIPGVDPEGEFSVLVANTGTAATTYTDGTVAAETRYTYRIKAINEYGESERSLWFHIDTPSAPVPDKPTGLTAVASDDRVVLTWEDPSDDSITGYVILRRIPGVDPEGEFSVLVANTGTAATTYTDGTVAAETRYTYRIKAINEYGESERSRWYHIDTPAAPEVVFVEGNDPDDPDDPVGAPGHSAPGGSGTKANVSEPSGEGCTTTTATTCEVDVGGGSVSGGISKWESETVTWIDEDDNPQEGTVYTFDTDWFAVELEEDKTYRIDMWGHNAGNDLTLRLPQINAIYNEDGEFLVNTFDSDESYYHWLFRVTFHAYDDGTYYIAASGESFEWGTYKLKVEEHAAHKPAVASEPPGLAPNAPNPFNASTLIPYRLDALGPVRLEIYNLLGQPVRTLVDQVQAAGAYQVSWDARDGRGGAVAAGVYLVRLHYPGGVQTQRMLYLK